MYNLAIEQRRTPIIDVLSISSGTNQLKRRLLIQQHARSASSFSATVPVEPGIEGGFCAIAVVGLRWTLRLIRLLGLSPDMTIQRLYYEFEQVLQKDSTGTSTCNSASIKHVGFLNKDDFLALESFCSEWNMYQELVRDANLVVLSRQATLNPDLMRLVFCDVTLNNLFQGNWENVNSLIFVQKQCCLPFLGITYLNHDSGLLHKAVIDRWKREEAGQSERNSPITEQVCLHMRLISKETHLATRTFVLHYLWKLGNDLIQLIQGASRAVPTPETITTIMPWMGIHSPNTLKSANYPATGRVWKTIKNACLEKLAKFLATDTKLASDKWCNEHRAELDALHTFIERLANGGNNTITIGSGFSADYKKAKKQKQEPSRLFKIGNDKDDKDADDAKSDMAHITRLRDRVIIEQDAKRDEKHQDLIQKICNIEKELYLSNYITQWSTEQRRVIEITKRYLSAIDHVPSRNTLQQWPTFLEQTLLVVPEIMYKTCADQARVKQLQTDLATLQDSRREWWLDHFAYKQHKINMYLYRWMGGIPYGITDRVDSMNKADFEARLGECIEVEANESLQTLEGERVFASQCFKESAFAQEIGFFTTGVTQFTQAIQVFQQECSSGECCSHLERIEPRYLRQVSGNGLGTSGHGHVRESKGSNSESKNAQVICVTVGEPTRFITSFWDAGKNTLATHHESLITLQDKIRKAHTAGEALLTTQTALSTCASMQNMRVWLEKFTAYLEARNDKWLADNITVPAYVQLAIRGSLTPRQASMTLEECLVWFIQCTIMTTFTSLL